MCVYKQHRLIFPLAVQSEPGERNAFTKGGQLMNDTRGSEI